MKCEFYIERSELFLTIRDDGVGFDAERVLSEKFRPEMGGNGLVSMRRRAVELGGTIAVLSAPGRGTAISLRIPLHPHENGTA